MSSRKGDTPPPAIPQEIKEDPFADWRVHGFDRSIHDGILAHQTSPHEYPILSAIHRPGPALPRK